MTSETCDSYVTVMHKSHKMLANAALSLIIANTVTDRLQCFLLDGGSDCSMSAGSSKAAAGRSKHNGGRDFRQHAYSQHHNMLSFPLLPLPEQDYTGHTSEVEKFCTLRIACNKQKLCYIHKKNFQESFFFPYLGWVF